MILDRNNTHGNLWLLLDVAQFLGKQIGANLEQSYFKKRK